MPRQVPRRWYALAESSTGFTPLTDSEGHFALADHTFTVRRPETEILLLISRTSLAPEAAARLRELLQRELDWPWLLVRSDRHSLYPLLYWHLNASAADLVPPAWLEFLRDLFRQNVQRSLLLTSELIQVVTQLQNAGITAVPYKGSVLASLAYGHLGLRRFQDLDILVRQSEILRAQEVIFSLGYGTVTGATPAQIAAGRIPGQYAYSRTREKILLEVHTERTLRYFPKPSDFDRLWERLETMELGGKRIPTLSPPDLFSFLCIHGTKHLWSRLSWICDIAELAGRQEPSEWLRIRERATSYGAERMVVLALVLARDVLGASFPPQAAAWIESDSALPALAQRLHSQIIADSPRWPSALERFLFRVRMRPRLGEGIRYGIRLATMPTEEDWNEVQNRGVLGSAPLALRRLFRLLTKYGLTSQGAAVDGDLAGYEPTPAEIVEKMLEFAELRPGDVLYDLGCGDGRVVIQAAKRYGVRAVGVDADPQRIAEARQNAQRESVGNLVSFRRKDARAVDLREATVVILYLPWAANLSLRETLHRKLRPGARIVSRNSGMGDWPPEKTEVVTDSTGKQSALFLWHTARPDRRR